MRRRWWVAIGALVIGTVTVVVAVAVNNDGQEPVTVSAGAPDGSEEQPDPSSDLTATSSPTTTVPESSTTTTVASTTTTASVAASTSTTARPVTTTTRPVTTTTQSRPALTLVPVGFGEPNLAGRRYFKIRVSGAGCSGPDRGWGISVSGPDGQYVDGNGGQGPPDGNWTDEFSLYYVHPAGRYTIQASCMLGSTLVFPYAPAYYDWPGTTL